MNLPRGRGDNVAYSDEATFSLDGEINTQNVRRYAPKKQAGLVNSGKPKQFRHTKSK